MDFCLFEIRNVVIVCMFIGTTYLRESIASPNETPTPSKKEII